LHFSATQYQQASKYRNVFALWFCSRSSVLSSADVHLEIIFVEKDGPSKQYITFQILDILFNSA